MSVFRIGFPCFRNRTAHPSIVRRRYLYTVDNISFVRFGVLHVPIYRGPKVKRKALAR